MYLSSTDSPLPLQLVLRTRRTSIFLSFMRLEFRASLASLKKRGNYHRGFCGFPACRFLHASTHQILSFLPVVGLLDLASPQTTISFPDRFRGRTSTRDDSMGISVYSWQAHVVQVGVEHEADVVCGPVSHQTSSATFYVTAAGS